MPGENQASIFPFTDSKIPQKIKKLDINQKSNRKYQVNSNTS